jgi:hypothetical protein
MHTAGSNAETPIETTRSANPLSCPVCNAALILLRGYVRCSRCYITLCVGCDGCPATPEHVAFGGEQE